MKYLWILALCISSFAQTAIKPSTPGQPSALNISWAEQTPNVAGFNVYRGTTAGGEDYSKPLASVAGTVFAYKDVSVTPGTVYFYTVTAVLGIESAPSNEVSKQAPVPPNPPVASIQ